MSALLEHIANADALIIAAPTYFLGPNARLKTFLDRGLMFYSLLDKLWGKPMLGVVTAGIKGMEGYSKLVLDGAIKIMGGRLLGTVVVFGAFPGEAVMGVENREKIRKAAEALISNRPIEEESGIRCPVCGGDSFRFGSNGFVKCLRCSNEGNWSIENGRLRMDIAVGEHRLFLSYEEAQKHADWLRGMKERFLEVRHQLKPVIQEFAGVGQTIVPPSKTEESREVSE